MIVHPLASTLRLADMASLLSDKSTQALSDIAESEVRSKHIDDNRKTLHKHLDMVHCFTDDRSKSSGKPLLRYASRGIHPSTAALKGMVRPEIRSTANSPTTLHNIHSELCSALSPTGTISSTSSPGVSNDTWDSPETPSHHPVAGSRIETQTPLTPPTTSNLSAKRGFIPSPPSSPLTFLTKQTTTARKVLACMPGLAGAKDGLTELDDFKPKKLIRSLTKELQASE